MTTGLVTAAGVDVDTVFLAGSGGAATGFQRSDGADLNALLAPYSSGTQVAATGLQLSTGADLSTRFQPKGGLTGSISPAGGQVSRNSSAGNGTISNVYTAQPAGGSGNYSYTWARASGSSLTFSSLTAQALTLSKTYTRNQVASYIESWQVTIKDNTTGSSVVVSMNVDFEVVNNA
jgi:hypothetical protein